MKRTTLLVLGLLAFYVQLSAQSMLKAVINLESPQIGCAPLTIKFRDKSSGPDQVVKWLWDFGDGTTSTEQHPTHVYAQPGVCAKTNFIHLRNPIFAILRHCDGLLFIWNSLQILAAEFQ